MEKDELIKHLEKRRSAHLKRLRALELQEARQGAETPPSVRVEIDELRDTIDGIDQELAATQKSTLRTKFATNTTTFRSSNFIQIEIIVRDPFESITPEIRSATVRAIAALVNIPAEQVKLLSVTPGSTIYRLEMPSEAVETLIELHATNDPLLATLEIERIERIKYRTKRGAMAESNSGGKQAWAVPIAVALIGAATTIIVALISNRVGQATGGEDARATAAIQQSTSVALAASTQIVVTSPPIIVTSPPVVVTSPPVTVVVTSPPVTVVVTSPPVVVTSPPEVVTATPEPTLAPPETTPPGTVLAVGDTWKQGGAELTLRRVELHGGDGAWLFMELVNRKSTEISIRVNGVDNFSAVDNNNRKLDVCFIYDGCTTYANYVIAPGDKVAIRIQAEPKIIVDTGDPTVNEVILKVVNVSTIPEARWRIPITH